ncbi:hypothetical protein [Leucobacter sp. NPDC077196]
MSRQPSAMSPELFSEQASPVIRASRMLRITDSFHSRCAAEPEHPAP